MSAIIVAESRLLTFFHIAVPKCFCYIIYAQFLLKSCMYSTFPLLCLIFRNRNCIRYKSIHFHVSFCHFLWCDMKWWFHEIWRSNSFLARGVDWWTQPTQSLFLLFRCALTGWCKRFNFNAWRPRRREISLVRRRGLRMWPWPLLSFQSQTHAYKGRTLHQIKPKSSFYNN